MNAARLAGMSLAVTIALTPVRDAIVASMTGHMLVQIPLLALAGFLMSARARTQNRTSGLNPGGVPGLVLTAAILTTWMIPRALDLAVTSDATGHLESFTVLAAGVLLRQSWKHAGAVGQAFFVGNLTWMAAVAGLLLRDAPVRVCTTYLVRDQLHAGTGLLLLATAVGVRWFTIWLAMPTAQAQRELHSAR